jgi:uncharacterized repeat protein (TIGR01451 family)
MRSLLVFSFLAFYFVGRSQIIDFPDANFKNALVNSKCVDTNGDGFGDNDADLNGDGEIDINEALKIQSLLIYIKSISSLSGIENFKNLINLNCDQNSITELDLSQLSELQELDVIYNKIKYLDLSKNINLKEVNCSLNELDSVNINGLSKLEIFTCYRNKLVDVNFRGCSNMKELRVWENKIEHLDLTDLVNLKQLYAKINPLETIKLTGLRKLTHILCAETKLKTIDVSYQRNIIHLDLDNCHDIETIFAKSGKTKEIPYIDLLNCRNLAYICADEISIDKFKLSLPSTNITELNSYCSFSPGKDYFVINGINYFDFNSDGCDTLDKIWPKLKFEITKDQLNTGLRIANESGKYTFQLLAGKYIIIPKLEFSDHFNFEPSMINTTFPSNSNIITQDFCITPKGIFRQTNITVIPLTPPARPGFDASYKIVWENVGNQIENGTLNFTYDETLLDYISATLTADQVADGIIKWNFTNLLPFEKREITVTLKVNRPTDTPAVNAGDKLYLTASILDNIFTLENTVVGSYDPNDKTFLQGDRVKPDMVGEYVDYLIRFENTGNYAAENVVVKDIIDTKTFDVSTLKITDASHEVYTRIDGNKVEFIFENIQLPFDDVNNDGYIAFKIKTLPTLVLGDSLKNLADIYFDYNFPIRTNEAQTTVAFPVFTKDITTEINIYPNPVTDILYLDTNENWTKAEIYDISGRIMRSVSLDNSTMNVRELESGTYFIRLKDGEKVGVVKFVKI